MAFVHLSVRSEFSIIDSIARIGELVAAAKADQQPALALTDLSNLFGTVKFYQKCLAAGIKPIIGSELMIESADQRATLFALNKTGYRQLTRIISEGYTQGKSLEANLGQPIIQKPWVFERCSDLVLVLGQRSDVGRALLSGNPEAALPLFAEYLKHFSGRIYFEIMRTGREGEDQFIQQVAWICTQISEPIPVIAVGEVRFIKPEDFDAHEAKVCISSGRVLADQTRPRDYSEDQYFKTQAEMQELFSDIPGVIENTLELARRCSVTIEIGKNYLPDFPIPEGATLESFLRDVSYEGLHRRLEFTHPVAKRGDDWDQIYREYTERMDFELKIIGDMGFPGYFLIVMDFIQWAKQNDVPVGPGRGSGAGSLVAYSLSITDLDPLEYELLFERFLNPERVSMPDFDIDFCVNGRDRVIDYVAQRYGRDAVSQIITFGTMAAKAVVRDVARVQGKSYGLADKMSKMIPGTPGITLKESFNQEPQLKALVMDEAHPDFEDASEIWEMALKLEGLNRNVGKHAGGVLIAPGRISDFTAVYTDEEGHRTSHFDKDDVEKVGLVKFDFLGLKNLTLINAAVKSINRRLSLEGKGALDITRLPLDDKPTYKLLQDAKSTAVFQLESAGMKRYLKLLKPTNINDVIAMCALYRPGPLDAGMVEMYIDRKHGREKVIYDHESLEQILGDTYGVIVYQEQVMQISQSMAGYTLGGADMLRRAMGKKKPEEMEKQRVIFVEGATQKQIDPSIAGGVFDLMEKFAGYGFNKSHSAAYGIIAYQTAYLKTHFTAEFMAEVLTYDSQNTDNVVFFIDDCRQFGIEVTPPAINESRYAFVAKDQETIVYGLSAIKGVGESAVESIVEERESHGPFKDLYEFTSRVDLKKVNKRCLEALIKAGAFDCLSDEGFEARGRLWAELPEAVAAAEQSRKSSEIGIMDLFGEVTAPIKRVSIDAVAMSDHERLKGEKATLGLYLTGHPINTYLTEIRQYAPVALADLTAGGYGETSRVAGMVIDVAHFGNRIVIKIEDNTARLEIACYPEKFERFKADLVVDNFLVAEVQLREREGFDRPLARLEHATSLESLRLSQLSQIVVTGVDAADTKIAEPLPAIMELQKQIRTHHQHQQQLGQIDQELNLSKLSFEVSTDYAKAAITLGSEYRISATNEMIQLLQRSYGSESLLYVLLEAHEMNRSH